MPEHSLRSRVTAGRFTLPAAILLAVAGWTLSGGWHAGWPLPCTLLTAWLLVLLNGRYSLIRVRASLQSSCYLLLTGCCTWLHHPSVGWVAGIAFLLSLLFFFHSYRHPEPQATLFHSFLMLGLGSLCWPPLLLLVPCYWVGAWHFSALHVRSFAASLMGLLAACGSYFSYAYCTDSLPAACRRLTQDVWPCPPSWSSVTTGQCLMLGYLLLLFGISTLHLTTHSYDEKLSTRSRLHFLTLLHLLLFLMALLQPAWIPVLLCLLPLGVSILAAHYFLLSRGRVANLIFLLSLVLPLSFLLVSLWIVG